MYISTHFSEISLKKRFELCQLPLLEKGDIIIDGGNSAYKDTERRCDYLRSKGLLFIGTGVSGGEEGARFGPSIMPGGAPEAWPHVKNIFQSISAKVDADACCDWVGEGGAGHFVKMVHNGIEYGDMQLICEAYDLMLNSLELSSDEITAIFDTWNKTELDSFLIEITAVILGYKDADKKPLLPQIKDNAGQVIIIKSLYILTFKLVIVFHTSLISFAERHRQMDGHGVARLRHSGDAHRRVGVRSLPFVAV